MLPCSDVAKFVKGDVATRFTERIVDHLRAVDAPVTLVLYSVAREYSNFKGEVFPTPRGRSKAHEYVLYVGLSKVIEKIVEHLSG